MNHSLTKQLYFSFRPIWKWSDIIGTEIAFLLPGGSLWSWDRLQELSDGDSGDNMWSASAREDRSTHKHAGCTYISFSATEQPTVLWSIYCSTSGDTVSEYCYWFKLEIGQRKKIASGNISALKSILVLHLNILQYLFMQKVIKQFFLKVRDVVLYSNLNLRPWGLTMPGNLSNSWQASQQTKHMGWQGLKRWPLAIIGGRKSCFHMRWSTTQWYLSWQTHRNLKLQQ